MRLQIDNKTLEVSKIGKGAFSSVYYSEETNEVFALTSTSKSAIDYSKEAIALYADKNNPHVPQIDVIENGTYVPRLGYVNVYKMPKYEKLTGDNLLIVNKIIKAYNEVVAQNSRNFRGEYYKLATKIIAAIDCLDIPQSIKEAIHNIYDVALNYGEYFIEFAKRNIMQDSTGNIVLLDITFNPQALE